MDDPWGSPWATDDSQLKLDLPAPPPRIHTPQTPNKIASPWAADDEEDAWGGWNAAGNNGGGDSPGWGRSPGLRPSRSGTVSRHVSPEPWGRVGLSDSKSDTEEKKSEKDAALAVDSAISLGEQPFAREPTTDTLSVDPEQGPEALARNQSPKPELGFPDPKDDVFEDEGENRDHPQSPIAEPSLAVSTGDRPEPTRQASKVQELVHMYDGIAKRKESPAEPLVPGPRITLVGADEATDEGAGTSLQTEEATAELPKKPAISMNEGFEEPGPDDSSQTRAATEAEEGPNYDDSAAPTHPTSFQAQTPSIPYAFDLAHLDDLFPTTPVPEIDPEPVPDVIIDDTFASISERKAWYRISRSGPMRQHNQGNDEDYVRLDWRRSEIRGGTLRIVRRWMEEDSIGGRVVLGRRTGPIGASMFNWDSQAPQVEIGQFFGKKEHRRSTSGASKGSRSSLASPTSATFAWSTEPAATESKPQPSLEAPKRNSWIAPPASPNFPNTASFGWSTSPKEDPEHENNAKVSDPSLVARKSPSPIPAPPRQPLQSINSVMANGANQLSTQQASIDEDEDEDEWGDMVSSPTWPSEIGTQTPTYPLAVTDTMVKVDSDPPVGRLPEQSTGSGGMAPSPWAAPSTTAKSSTIDEAWDMGSTNTYKSPLGSADPQLVKGPEYKPSNDMLDLWSTNDPPEPKADIRPDLRKATPLSKNPNALNAIETETVENILKNLPDLSYMLR